MNPNNYPQNPWLGIWVQPRETIRAIVASDPARHVIILSGLAGFGRALDRAAAQHLGDLASFLAVLLAAAIAGPALGVAWVYLLGGMLRWVGRRMGGPASARELRAVSAWSAVPSLFGLPLLLAMIVLVGDEIFMKASPRLDARLEENPGLSLALFLCGSLQVFASIWSIQVFVRTLAEVQHFTILKAVRNLIVASLALIALAAIPITLFIVAMTLMRPTA